MALSTQAWLSLAAALPLLLYIYIRTNDAKISRLTPEAVALSPRRWTDEEVRRVASEPEMLSPSPSLFAPEELGPKTGRRYIVIGGVSAACLKSLVPFAGCATCAGYCMLFLRDGRSHGSTRNEEWSPYILAFISRPGVSDAHIVPGRFPGRMDRPAPYRAGRGPSSDSCP